VVGTIRARNDGRGVLEAGSMRELMAVLAQPREDGGVVVCNGYKDGGYIRLALIGKELGLSYTEIGLIMAVQNAVGALSNIPGGVIVDMVGRKGYLMAISLFWVGFPYALMSLTHSYWMLLVCVTLVGIGNNLWHPTAIPTLAHRYSDRKGFILALHGMGGNVGEAIAPLFIGLLLTYMSWRAAVRRSRSRT